MRIIAGTHRGRQILPPEDASVTRPIVDRVKESLFDRLMSLGMLAGPAEGAEPWRAVDVFSGTGSLGLEALSRGAEHATFIERDRGAIDRLKQNIETFGWTRRAAVVATSALQPVWVQGLAADSIRVVFLDPPYPMMEPEQTADRRRLTDVMEALVPRLEPGGVVVLRTHEDAAPLKPRAGLYDGPMSFTYGTMTLHFYQRPLPEEPADVAAPSGETST